MKSRLFLISWLLCLPLTAWLWSCGGSSGDGDKPLVAFETFQSASLVIGQTNFTSGTENAGRGTGDLGDIAGDGVVNPAGNAAIVNSRLYLPDSNNNRVLGFDTLPSLNSSTADFALGQNDLASAGTGSGSGQLAGPQTVKAADGKLFVTDTDNNRVLIWNNLPDEDGAAAEVVVGQVGFGFGAPSTAANRLNGPQSCIVVDGKLIVADTGNNRILIWNSIPIAGGADADLVLGQDEFDRNTANDHDQDGLEDTNPSARTLNSPTDVWSDGNRLIIADRGNNRVLIWASFPTEDFAPAIAVLGQASMTTATAGTSAAELDTPTALACNGQKLYIADRNNHRVLGWNDLPSANFAEADLVLGQSDFTHGAPNDDDQNGTADGQPSARTFRLPSGIELAGSRLLVSDTGNNRFLLFEGP